MTQTCQPAKSAERREKESQKEEKERALKLVDKKKPNLQHWNTLLQFLLPVRLGRNRGGGTTKRSHFSKLFRKLMH